MTDKPTTAEQDFIALLRKGSDVCKNRAKANPRFVNEDVSLASMLDGAADRLEATEAPIKRWIKNHDLQMQRAITAEALIKEIGELPDRFVTRFHPAYQSGRACRWCARELQAILDKLDAGVRNE